MPTLWLTLDQIEVKAAATSNVATLSGAQTVGGAACVANDLVLLQGQTDQTSRGPYLVQAGAWLRVVSLRPGQEFFVASGTNAGKTYELTTASFFLNQGTGVCTDNLSFEDKTGNGGTSVATPISKANGGFGTSVAAGLTNNHVAIVDGNAMAIGPLPAAALPTSGITAGTYVTPTLTIDQYGRATSVLAGYFYWTTAKSTGGSNGASIPRLRDQSGNGYSLGVNVGAVTLLSTGGPGSQPAFNFDGNAVASWTYSALGPTAIPGGSPNITVGALLYIGSLAADRCWLCFGSAWAGGDDGLGFSVQSNGSLIVGTSAPGHSRGTQAGTVVINTWYRIIMQVASGAFSSSNPKIYVDGVLKTHHADGGTWTGTPSCTPNLLHVGALVDGGFSWKFLGRIADVRVVLSAADADAAAMDAAIRIEWGL